MSLVQKGSRVVVQINITIKDKDKGWTKKVPNIYFNTFDQVKFTRLGSNDKDKINRVD